MSEKKGSLIERDRASVWHPFTHLKGMKGPIPAVRGEGAYLYDEEGKAYLDAISSWWVNLHGHCHPHILKRIREQSEALEHVIFAGFTHPPAVELSEALLDKAPGEMGKVFYSDNGSTAMEVAVKMALQYWHNQGKERKRIVAFDSGYHGDTFGAMSVSGRSAFNAPFDPYLFEVLYIETPLPGREERSLQQLRELVEQGDVAAFVYEPMVQGAAGMLMYEAGVLDAMLDLCEEHGILRVADEVFTGFGRTGRFFASDHLTHPPDIMALSKGLTGGTMALAATICSDQVQEAFISEDRFKTFFHGHSFTGNPIACAAGCANMELLEEEGTWEGIRRIEEEHARFIERLASSAGIRNARQQGTILALEIVSEEKASYFNPMRDRIRDHFLEKGILLRPLGNELYVVPPYCIETEDLERVYREIESFAEQYADA